jgi:hypothetical protein
MGGVGDTSYVKATITFNGNPNSVMTHKSTLISDTDGSRSATLVFNGDNMAYLVDENGNDIHQLPTISVRATDGAISAGVLPARSGSSPSINRERRATPLPCRSSVMASPTP